MIGAARIPQPIPFTTRFQRATSPSSRRARGGRVIILLAAGLFALTMIGAHALADGLPRAAPGDVGMNAQLLQQVDSVVQEGLDAERMPGCVVALGRRGKLVFLKAYGFRQLKPTKAAMTVDTVFDLASLTKPIVTATSVMKLVEQGRIRLHDRVSDHLPEFGQNGKQTVTILQLLTHQGGLLPDNALKDYLDGPDEAWKKIFALDLHRAGHTVHLHGCWLHRARQVGRARVGTGSERFFAHRSFNRSVCRKRGTCLPRT